jgi:hypothetical protein
MVKTVAKIVDDKIHFAVKRDVIKKMNLIIPIVKSETKSKVSSLILTALNDSNTVQSLLSGKLKDDFGLFGNVVNTTINNIVKEISNGIDLKMDISNKSDTIVTTTLYILPYSDFPKIASVPGASFPSKRGNVDWLEWLLARGTQVVIGDFWIFPYAKGITRSGGTSIMKEIESKPRKPFRVDPNYAGTLTDNFITRAIQSISDDILKILKMEIDRRF